MLRKRLYLTLLGHYEATAWDDQTRSYIPKPDVGVFITVQETFDNNHRVVAQRGSDQGRFTFSAADSGEHRLCFTPQNVPSSGGWGSSSDSAHHGTVKLQLDLAIGETSKIESTDKGKIDDIVQRVRDLNGRLQDIRREQVFQRVCARAIFRILSLWHCCHSNIEEANEIIRNVKPNFVTSPNPQMPASSDGH